MIEKPKLKRHNVQFGDDLYQQLQLHAGKRGVSVTDFIRTCLKVGLLAIEMENQGGDLIVRRQNQPDLKLLVVG